MHGVGTDVDIDGCTLDVMHVDDSGGSEADFEDSDGVESIVADLTESNLGGLPK